MRARYQIVISTRRSPAAGQPKGFRGVTALLIGLGCLIIAIGVLAMALIFGSILAAVLWICLGAYRSVGDGKSRRGKSGGHVRPLITKSRS